MDKGEEMDNFYDVTVDGKMIGWVSPGIIVSIVNKLRLGHTIFHLPPPQRRLNILGKFKNISHDSFLEGGWNLRVALYFL